MNKGFFGFLAFVTGGTIGFAAANWLLKDGYERAIRDEVESVKAAFRRSNDSSKEKESDDTRESAQRANQLGYTERKCPASRLLPRVISPDEFGSIDEYEQITLTYFADNTLADDRDHAMGENEIEETVGAESLRHFGEYEDDSVFVRNDRLKVDFEILLDERTYADVLQQRPDLLR